MKKPAVLAALVSLAAAFTVVTAGCGPRPERPTGEAEASAPPVVESSGAPKDSGARFAAPAPSPEKGIAESGEPEDVQKRSLAVLDFTIHTSNDPRQHEEFQTNLLTDKLTSALAQTRKFRIVERQRIDNLLREFKLSEQGFAAKEAAVKAGEMVGADYMLTGSINALGASSRTEAVPYTNETVTTMSGRVAADMRIVDSRTGEIVAAWRAESSHAKSGAVDREAFLDSLQQDLARKLVEKILEAVYPVKVAEIQPDGVVYLNRGEGGGLRAGDNLDVFQPGKVIVDPDTREVIGASEVKVGSIRVLEVRPRVTLAQVTGGQVSPGAIARPAGGKPGSKAGGAGGSAKARPRLAW